MALRVAVTGGIGSGKSAVTRHLRELGAVVVDADVLAREAVAAGTPGLAQVVEAFGTGVLLSTGELDRPALGRLVFADPSARQRLEAIIHPVVRARAAEIEQAAVRADPAAVVVHDIPLLVESRGRGGFDVVLVVDVPADLQIERLVSLRSMSREDAQSRVAAQATREERLAIADEVIENTGSLDDLDRRVTAVWQVLLGRAGASSSG